MPTSLAAKKKSQRARNGEFGAGGTRVGPLLAPKLLHKVE